MTTHRWKYIGDTDDDNDDSTTLQKHNLGSNPKNESDAKKVDIEGAEYYLIDINRDGTFDISTTHII